MEVLFRSHHLHVGVVSTVPLSYDAGVNRQSSCPRASEKLCALSLAPALCVALIARYEKQHGEHCRARHAQLPVSSVWTARSSVLHSFACRCSVFVNLSPSSLKLGSCLLCLISCLHSWRCFKLNANFLHGYTLFPLLVTLVVAFLSLRCACFTLRLLG